MKIAIIILALFAILVGLSGCATESIDSRALFERHSALWKESRWDEAAAMVPLDGKGLDTNDADVCIMLARACEMRNHPEGAKAWALRALELDPGRPEAMSRYSEGCLILKDYAEGIRFAKEMMALYPELSGMTLARFARHYFYAQLHEEGFQVAALAYLRDEKNPWVAAEFFRMGFRVRPFNSVMPQVERWLSLYKATPYIYICVGVGMTDVTWKDKDRAELALEYLGKAWEQRYKSALLVQYTMSNLRVTGDLRRTEDFIQQVQAVMEPEVDLWVIYGAMCGDKGNWQKAYEINLKALAVDPEDAQAGGNDVFFLFRLKRYEEAISRGRRWLQEGFEVHPVLHQGMGHSFYNLKRYPEAEQSYRKAHEMVPHSPNYVRDIIWSLARQGKTYEAVKLAHSWIEAHDDLEDASLDMVRRAMAQVWSEHVRSTSGAEHEKQHR